MASCMVNTAGGVRVYTQLFFDLYLHLKQADGIVKAACSRTYSDLFHMNFFGFLDLIRHIASHECG
jgi:hypothetical protein